MLAEMVQRRCKGGVLEVSGEALTQRSFDGVAFHAALVTDIAAPLGFPTDVLVQKRRAKARLFRQIAPGGVAVVNANDPNAEMLGGVNINAQRVAFALDPAAVTRGAIDVCARLERIDGSGTRMRIHGFSRELSLHVPLVGIRVMTWRLAAAALAWAMEIDQDHVIAGLEAVQTIGGHLEAVNEDQDFDVRIDAARTPEALAEALDHATSHRCGTGSSGLEREGHGDRAMRRQLAEIAEMGADRITLTLSNPRTEDPDQILDDLLAGFRRPGKVLVEPDRRIAIETTLAHARAGDVVLIAGKGRHAYQIFADSVTPFDDRAVARQWLRIQRPAASRYSA